MATGEGDTTTNIRSDEKNFSKPTLLILRPAASYTQQTNRARMGPAACDRQDITLKNRRYNTLSQQCAVS
jgi:hypothetical protein